MRSYLHESFYLDVVQIMIIALFWLCTIEPVIKDHLRVWFKGRRGVKIMKLLDLYMPPLSGNGISSTVLIARTHPEVLMLTAIRQTAPLVQLESSARILSFLNYAISCMVFIHMLRLVSDVGMVLVGLIQLATEEGNQTDSSIGAT
ncbi:hypothetical protein QQP08_005305 [Theobroma cacao]|nr:hypothetical protein QQP08_005305 [Theobroma cacao]